MLRGNESPSKDFEKEICVFCEKRYLSTETLKQHILTDHKPSSYKCENDDCNKIFITKIRMLDHVDVVHMKRNVSSSYRRKTIIMKKCPIDVCEKMESTKVSLVRHILSNHLDRRNLSFKCKFCTEEFVNQHKLGGHRRRKHPEEREFKAVEKYRCLFCDKMLMTKFSLNLHMSRKHSDIPEDQRLIPERKGNSSQCKFCEKKFEGKFVLGTHTKREHPGKSRNWSKHQMQQMFRAIEAKLDSSNTIGDDTDDPDDPVVVENHSVHTSAKYDPKFLKADKEDGVTGENGKGSKNQDISNSKGEIVDRSREFFLSGIESEKLPEPVKSLSCEKCNYVARTQGSLKEHILYKHEFFLSVIVKEKLPETVMSLSCEKCNHVANRQGSLRMHVLYKHGGKKHKCIICSAGFVRLRDLKRHIVSKHEEEKLPEDFMSLSCEKCNYITRTPGELKEHILYKHEGIKQECTKCSSTFARERDLKRHIVSKHGFSEIVKDEPLSVSPETTNIPSVNENCDQNQLDSSNTIGDDDPVEKLFVQTSETSAKDNSKHESIADNEYGVAEENVDPVENLFVQTFAKDDSEADKESEENEKRCRNQDITNSKIELNDIVGECFVTDNFETGLEKESTKVDIVKESEIGIIPDGIGANSVEIPTQKAIVQEIDRKEEYDFPAYRRTRSEEISTHPDFRKEHWNEDKVLNARHVGEKRHMCERCPFSCDRPYILRDHILSKHEGQRIECNICNARFQRSKNLREHIRTKHAKEKIMCEICDFATNWRVALVKHQQTRHGIVKEKIPETLSCEKCDHVARTHGSLKEHILYKHGGTKHQCTKCPSSFVRERDQKRHIVSKHQFTDILKEEPLSPNSSPCDKCNHVARSGWCLREHIASRHEGIKHQCEKCATLFVRERDLKRHIVSKH